jgi:hypothetical protein
MQNSPLSVISPFTYAGAGSPSANPSGQTGQISPDPANDAQYQQGVGNLSYLLGSQGDPLVNPFLDLSLRPDGDNTTFSATSSASGDGSAPAGIPSAGKIAQQIMQELGSNNELDLSSVKQVLCNTPPGAISNTDGSIAFDFSKIADGTGEMTLSQLTAAVQGLLNRGGWTSNGPGEGGLVSDGHLVSYTA